MVPLQGVGSTQAATSDLWFSLACFDPNRSYTDVFGVRYAVEPDGGSWAFDVPTPAESDHLYQGSLPVPLADGGAAWVWDWDESSLRLAEPTGAGHRLSPLFDSTGSAVVDSSRLVLGDRGAPVVAFTLGGAGHAPDLLVVRYTADPAN